MRNAARTQAHLISVEVDEPDVGGETEALLRLVGDERGGQADDERRWRTQQLLGRHHARGQQRDHREHVLQWVEHRHHCEHAHRKRVAVARLQHQLLLEQHQLEHREARVHAEQLERQVQREVHEPEARRVRQRKLQSPRPRRLRLARQAAFLCTTRRLNNQLYSTRKEQSLENPCGENS